MQLPRDSDVDDRTENLVIMTYSQGAPRVEGKHSALLQEVNF